MVPALLATVAGAKAGRSPKGVSNHEHQKGIYMSHEKNDVLALHAVSKEYLQGGRVLPVLHNVSVSFTQGNAYAVTGVSGSGKSTLLHLLGGLDTPSSGTVTFNTKNIATMRASHKNTFLNHSIGFVFQFHYLIKELSVHENVMMMGLIKGESRKQCTARADHLLSMVGLIDKARAFPTQLSGGEQQRVAIARALFNKPSFLLADEPTGNLDTGNAQQVVDLFLAAQQEWGMGIVVCTHDSAVHSRMSTVFRLFEGSLVVERE